VGIDEPPQEMFGKIMSISDALMLRYYELLSDLTVADLERLKADLEGGACTPGWPRKIWPKKWWPATTVRRRLMKPPGSSPRFSGRRPPDQIEEVQLTVAEKNVWLPKVLHQAGLTGAPPRLGV